MTRVRYLLLWVIVSFLLIFALSWVIEGFILETEAMQVQTLTELAADSALQAGQGIDDFFVDTNDSGNWEKPDGVLGTGGINDRDVDLNEVIRSFSVKYTEYSSDSEYKESDLFKWYFNHAHASNKTNGTDPTVLIYGSTIDRRYAFKRLYDGTGYGTAEGWSDHSVTEAAKQFREFALSPQCLRSCTQIPYFDTDGTLYWVTVPKIALIGSRCIWMSEADYKADTNVLDAIAWNCGGSNTQETEYSVANGWAALRQNNYRYGLKSGAFGSYFLTPSKVGITYINRELVQAIYQNNIDLIMRYKYNNDKNLYDHAFVLRNSYLVQSPEVDSNITEYEYNNDNKIVNNGLFTVNKDKSTITNIEYKSLDVYDEYNNALIKQIYGGSIEFVDANQPYSEDNIRSIEVMTANRMKDKYKLRHITYNQPENVTNASKNNIVVAKVTFTSDVILNHKTATFTTWCTKYDKDRPKNYNDIVQTTGTDTNKSTDSNKYTYTRYYVVTA